MVKCREEKDEVMTRFSQHEIDILVSTTVVEVGVNVPNATFMMIYDAPLWFINVASIKRS